MKLLYIFILFSLSSFAQNDPIFCNVKLIDSIAKKYGRQFISDGSINIAEENNKFQGRGGFSYQTFIYNPDLEKWKDLPKAEKREFDLKKNQTLIKGIYHEVIHFNGSRSNSEEIIGEFYYCKNKLFLIKITERTYKGEEELFTSTYLVKYSDSYYSNLAPELTKWIQEKNESIINYYKQ